MERGLWPNYKRKLSINQSTFFIAGTCPQDNKREKEKNTHNYIYLTTIYWNKYEQSNISNDMQTHKMPYNNCCSTTWFDV